MCGRFTLSFDKRALKEQFGLREAPESEPRYNIAPSQQVLAIRAAQDSAEPEAMNARWGLIPIWAKDAKIGSRMINARSETARTKPSFRSAYKSRRCIIPASGFYEWKREEKRHQPFVIYDKDFDLQAGRGPALALAGLWERWESPADGWIKSVTILTTVANDFMTRIHDRMPVILEPDTFALWLDPESAPDDDAFEAIREPIPDDRLAMHPVKRDVNSPRNDRPDLLEPVENPEPFRRREYEHDSRQGGLF